MNIHIHAFDATQSIDVKNFLPIVHIQDNLNFKLKDLFIERSKFHIDKIRIEDIETIEDFKFDDYFIGLIDKKSKIGSKKFVLLRDAGRLELTTEFIVFHNFRERLDLSLRQAIAKLLAASVSHPHAVWEEKSKMQKVYVNLTR